MTRGNFLLKGAAASAGDEFTAAEGNCFLEQSSGQRSTDPGMEESQTLIFVCDFIYGMRPSSQRLFTRILALCSATTLSITSLKKQMTQCSGMLRGLIIFEGSMNASCVGSNSKMGYVI